MAQRKAKVLSSGSPTPYAGFTGTCCWPECEREIGVINAPLCKPHLIKVYITTQDTYLWLLEPGDPKTPEIKPPVSKRFRRQPDQGLVYFIRLGSLVKIGFTTNFERRMTAVPHEEILGTRPGTMQDERAFHDAFAHLRVTGEWFRAEPVLLEFIKDVAAA